MLGSRVIDRLNWLFTERKRVEKIIATQHYTTLLGPKFPPTTHLYTRLPGSHVDPKKNEAIIRALTREKDDACPYDRDNYYNPALANDPKHLRAASEMAKDYRTGIVPASYWVMFGALLWLISTGVGVPLWALYLPVASLVQRDWYTAYLLGSFFAGVSVLVIAFGWMLFNLWQVRHVSWPWPD